MDAAASFRELDSDRFFPQKVVKSKGNPLISRISGLVKYYQVWARDLGSGDLLRVIMTRCPYLVFSPTN